MADAFKEGPETQTPKPAKAIRLLCNEDGTINWDASGSKPTERLLWAIRNDPNNLVKTLQDDAATAEDISGVADVTVLAAANLIMCVEALGLSVWPAPKMLPVFRNLHPVVALKACSVTKAEIEPILEPGKRLIKKYVPSKYLSQDLQDVIVCAEHLGKLSIQKFKECLDLAREIERVTREAEQIQANGRGTKVEIN